SVVAMAAGRPIGIALLSLREDEGWVSGVGVIPAWRRQGVGRAIMLKLQETAREEGLTRLRLEVLHENRAGRRLYQQIGFTHYRDLLVLRMPSKPALPPPYARLSLSPSRPQALLRHHGSFHRIDPSWQRALPSLRKRADRIQGLGLWMDEALVGYILYQAQPDVCHVLDLVVDPALSGAGDLARRMLLSLHGLYPELGGYVVNVPQEDPLLAAFTEIGYSVWHRQDEMVWPVRERFRPYEV
ncbi:MAG: GNAT family N-acetyltransferase, partial [Anaerolineae bacterium]|nr:GNAT family N-acetyltransferase [Anaerolineae bacterium]